MEHTPKFNPEPPLEDGMLYLPVTRETGQEQLAYWQNRLDHWWPLIAYHKTRLGEAQHQFNVAAEMVGVVAVALWNPAGEEELVD
jgi:hypothetical protein